jgi:hypothetical protein
LLLVLFMRHGIGSLLASKGSFGGGCSSLALGQSASEV